MQLCRATLELSVEKPQDDKSFFQARKRALEQFIENIKSDLKQCGNNSINLARVV